MRTNTVVAIDGYSSCGKSTLAKALAENLGFIYIDSGAMYRAVSLYFLRNSIDIKNTYAITEAIRDITLRFDPLNKSFIALNNEDVSEEIRKMPVSVLVSKVAAIEHVREHLVRLQQDMGKMSNIIMDGRDIGTAVFPDARIKFFMTATPEVRAERRFRELQANGDFETTYKDVFESLSNRDYADITRDISPLIQAEDAIVIDNTYLTQTEQLELTLQHIKKIC